MMGKRSLVTVVDDDESVRESLPDLIRQFGFTAQAFSSADDVTSVSPSTAAIASAAAPSGGDTSSCFSTSTTGQ